MNILQNCKNFVKNSFLQKTVNPKCILYVSTDAVIIFGLKTFSWGKKSKKVKIGGKGGTFPPGKVHKFFGK